MTTKVAPWLQGLSDEPWELPKQQQLASSISSASHNASSLRGSQSRIPRRSLSGLPASFSRQTSGSQNSTQKKRAPLASLSKNDANTMRRGSGLRRSSGARSISYSSCGSDAACGTVQQRSKSASPSKKQETMEWKKRLVNGQLGYGDQTDLFGATGLENIFSRSNGGEIDDLKPKKRMSWLQKSDVPMPSSPPPWTSSFVEQIQNKGRTAEEPLEEVVEDITGEVHGADEDAVNDSFRSNPFDLESEPRAQFDDSEDVQQSTNHVSSPNKAFIEISEEETSANRTVSGQTELEQEDFSPVFISKHHTITGQVDYAALDSHTVKHFQSLKVDLRHPSHHHCDKSAENSEIHHPDGPSTFTDGPESQAQPDLSFSENLPTGSPFPNLGKHVELRRGGYSQYGSFKRRPLSPSQSTVEPNPLNNSAMMSSMPPVEDSLPAAPTPPRTPDATADRHEPKPKSSGSPLKLFGAYDTFTNDKLLRRLSQLNPDGSVRQPDGVQERQRDKSPVNSSSDSFGSGHLDDHEFNAEITITSASDEDEQNSTGSPGSEVPVPGSKTPAAFRFDPSPHVTNTYKLKRKLSKHSTATSKGSTKLIEMQPTVEEVDDSQLHVPATEPMRTLPDGKRPPTSPFKSPTPKRRRTLHASELEDYMTRVNDTYHSQLQEAVSSRKRKDARRGETQITADPEVLAQRKILRPRNPTPSQRRREQIEAELREAAEEFAEQEPGKLEAVLEQIESSLSSDVPRTLLQQAEAVASEVAAFTLRVNKPSGEHGERKRSVTTQDFLNEAMMVMNLIRAKARPQSNLGSVGESDGETGEPSLRPGSSHLDQSALQVSRPPSREHSGWRQRTSFPTDARVVSHLRKFQEQDELGDETDFIQTSLASLRVDDDVVNDAVLIVDDESKIRITGPPSRHGKDTAESDSRPHSQRSQGSTLDTQNSNGTSTGRTIASSSTKKSDNVGTLAPDAVAHLIGEEVGGMTFDKQQQRWVRVNKSPAKSTGSFLELPSTVTSDDDPFREISDLPVDEHKELRRISSPGKFVDGNPEPGQTTSIQDHLGQPESEPRGVESRTTSQETVIERPVTREGPPIQHNHSSSVPSRYTAFASSQQQEKIETRATSWSDEELARMSAFGKARNQPLAYAAAQAEIARRNVLDNEQHHERAQLPQSTPAATSRFDSKTAYHLADLPEDSELVVEDSETEDIQSTKLRQTPAQTAFQSTSYRSGGRQVSLRRQTLTNRLNTGQLEHSELSFVAPLPGDRMVSLSLSVSRPTSNNVQPYKSGELQSSPSKVNSSFLFSDLPDFTVHENDAQQRPSERSLAQRLAKHAADEINDRYALAVKDLVKTLTDIHESEPFWEDLKQLDLHARSIASLYGLEDFCCSIQSMNVSQNALTHLQGVPLTVRRLNVRANQLSSLTSWNHLMNLQYLDVSSNNLESLDALRSLIHLRELRADDNKISNLSGLFDLDGLLVARLRRNNIREIDFAGSQLKTLVSLDLSHNPIRSFKSLHALISLKELTFDGAILPRGLEVEQELPCLTSLSVRNCSVEHLDVARCPKLRLLQVDDNRLSTIDGLSHLTNLDLLSMRRQTLAESVRIHIFDNHFDTRALYLSGNNLPTLHLSTDFPSVQTLELASSGLQHLPADFGLRFSNLRTLNLNYNSLADIRPLLNIHGLEHLSVCGNRLHRLRKSALTFAKMSSLRDIDMRDTPLTQAFYPNLVAGVERNTTLVRIADTSMVEDEDENAAKLEKALYGHAEADVERDRTHWQRLDEDTKLRRRVHEMLILSGCSRLESLDGLKVNRKRVNEKDDTWARLVELGLLKKSEKGDVRTIDDRHELVG